MVCNDSNEFTECALHVHVQAPESLDALEELAIILLIYEEEISRLHPPCRRPYSKNGQDGPRGSIDSNRIFWVLPDSTETPDRSSRQFQDLDRTLAELKRQYRTVDELKNYVRYRIPDENRAKERLIKRMNYPAGPDENGQGAHRFGNRNRIVNFTTAIRGPEFPKTIEFRQARGSLCDQEIMHWVKFCIGLVQLADFYRETPEKFRVKDWEDVHQSDGTYQRNKIDVFDLMRDMQLGDDEISYWQTKVAFY